MSEQKKIDEREQAIYGDIPAGEANVSPEYLEEVLPEHLKARIAERDAGKKAPKKDKADGKPDAE